MKEGFESTIAELKASVVKLKKVGVMWCCCDCCDDCDEGLTCTGERGTG
jgi:hypothetical protein